eukprot:3517310-Alexandrium_andersonii.AAC.1
MTVGRALLTARVQNAQCPKARAHAARYPGTHVHADPRHRPTPPQPLATTSTLAPSGPKRP